MKVTHRFLTRFLDRCFQQIFNGYLLPTTIHRLPTSVTNLLETMFMTNKPVTIDLLCSTYKLDAPNVTDIILSNHNVHD